jgi:hypothetical protein
MNARIDSETAARAWAHFSESRAEIERAFDAAGLADRLRWPAAGRSLELR